MVYYGDGLVKPMNEIGVVFKEEYGVQINYTFTGSADNLSKLQLVQEVDVYMSGDRYYSEQLADKGLTEYEKDVAYLIPIIAVPKGNPANIKNLDDLTRDGVKIILGDENSVAVDKVCQKILKIIILQKK